MMLHFSFAVSIRLTEPALFESYNRIKSIGQKVHNVSCSGGLLNGWPGMFGNCERDLEKRRERESGRRESDLLRL